MDKRNVGAEQEERRKVQFEINRDKLSINYLEFKKSRKEKFKLKKAKQEYKLKYKRQ